MNEIERRLRSNTIRTWLLNIGTGFLVLFTVGIVALSVGSAIYFRNDPDYWEPMEDFWTFSTATPAPTATQEVIRIELVIMTPTAQRGRNDGT